MSDFTDNFDALSAEKLRPLLSDGFGEVIIKEVTESTNDDAKDLAIAGAPDFTAVISICQKSGRGQHGRPFVSERGGLFLSIVACRGVSAEKASFITLCAAVAVMKAVEKICGIRPKIKWINDLLINGKKICGILTESRIIPGTKNLEYAVIGIGVNINNENFPNELKNTATSLFTETGEKYSLQNAAAEVLNALFAEINRFDSGEFIAEYKENLVCIVPPELHNF
jgi:BirA family biotin operon repressor/biotin-[acetyl-CoA-carboxylase] ligase